MKTLQFPNRTVHDHVREVAAAHPDRPAILTEQESWTWREFSERIAAGATALDRLGAARGDRIVFVSENSASTLAMQLAAQSRCVWPAVANARLPATELLRMVDCVTPRWLVFASAESDSAAAHAQALGANPFTVAGLSGMQVVERHADAKREPSAERAVDETALMLFTSGTTGMPKAVMFSHEGLMNMGAVIGASRGTSLDDTIDLGAPLAHIMAHSSVLCALVHGATLRIRPRLIPRELAGAIARGELTQASMVPVAWSRLIEQIDREHIDISCHQLRMLVSAGAPLDPSLKRRIEETFHRPVINAYGMTECAPIARVSPSGDSPAWSVGRPEENVEIRLVDSQGLVVAHGDVGEIQTRGPGVMKGYYQNSEATKAAIHEGGWFATGDLGRWLPNGELAVVGRTKEMIIRSGFNVYPAEVEGAITSHADVLLAAVVGEPGEQGDETVVAYVQLRPGIEHSEAVASDLAAHVRCQLAPYKCPSRYQFVSAMPLGSTGKILKRELSKPPSN